MLPMYQEWQYDVSLSFLIQVLTCEVQTSEADKSQRNLLRDSFQKSLINDSEKLLTLQQAFLTPRPKNQNGLYLYAYVTVEGRTTDINSDSYYFIDGLRCGHSLQNNTCVYQTSTTFELMPPDQDVSAPTVQNFLTKEDIRMMLEVLDPSFHALARMLRSLDTDYYVHDEPGYRLEIMVDKVEIILNELQTDVHDALYLTLSWVSLMYVAIAK